MTPKGKVYIEEQKKSAQAKLEARRVFLKEKGSDDDAIRKDAAVRKLKAAVRKADFRLSSIAAQEKQNQDLVKATADKKAARAEKKAAGKQTKKEAKEAKEAKEGAPEKKEKKAKKEKPEKQAKTKEKKEGSEEKKGAPEEKEQATV